MALVVSPSDCVSVDFAKPHKARSRARLAADFESNIVVRCDDDGLLDPKDIALMQRHVVARKRAEAIIEGQAPHPRSCKTCDGTGDLGLTADRFTGSRTCGACAGTGIERALVRFHVSVGRIEPDTTRAGLDGLVTVHWKFAGFIGILPPQSTAELSACASNSTTRCDQYWSLVVIGFNPP